MKIKKEALLYDIANLAFVIADTHDYQNHALHRVTDICEDGNRDRVARVLGLAYLKAMTVISPVAETLSPDISRDYTKNVRDYEIRFKAGLPLTSESKLKIRATVQEYMECMVLADWLGITLPEVADIWKTRAEGCLSGLASAVISLTSGSFRRHVPAM